MKYNEFILWTVPGILSYDYDDSEFPALRIISYYFDKKQFKQTESGKVRAGRACVRNSSDWWNHYNSAQNKG